MINELKNHLKEISRIWEEKKKVENIETKEWMKNWPKMQKTGREVTEYALLEFFKKG